MKKSLEARSYFPLGKAHDMAFCNRVQELVWLQENIQVGKHSLLIAPRRYGKSSLAEAAIIKTGMPYVQLNFHLCTSVEEVTRLIVNGVAALISQIASQIERVARSIVRYVTNLTPKISLGNNLATLELVPKQGINHAVIIAESLILLDKLLQERKQQAVIFFDEFQDLTKISKETSVEGAIRTAAQETKNLAIVFSGSIRSLLLSMFEEENRPLYKLCRKLRLERIHAKDYQPHLDKIACATWRKALTEATFAAIMELSSRHPYYVNYLCDTVWRDCRKLPKVEQIELAWKTVVMEERSDVHKEITDLPMTQRRVLRYIARNRTSSMASKAVYTELNMPVSTVVSVVESLIDKDYIETDAEGVYRIINPVLATVMKEQI